MTTFSDVEQALFLSSPRFVQAASATAKLTILDMCNGLASFNHDLIAQLKLLDTYPEGKPGMLRLGTVDYDRIRSMIRNAPNDQRAKVRGEEWRRVFVALCDKNTIGIAVFDLGLTEPERSVWLNAKN